MPRVFFYDGDAPREQVYLHSQPPRPRKRYGFFKFSFDAFMTMITGGFWLIWIFVREMRKP